MDQADVSVIIPCFNCGNTIERAVDSVMNQTHEVKEIILINDCSTDSTLIELNKIKNKYNSANIKIIDLLVNVGAAKARNLGWDVAAGKYLAFLDADDSWSPLKIKIQYKIMTSNPNITMVGHLCKVINKKLDTNSNQNLNEINTIRVSAYQLLLKNYFSTPTVMLLREIKKRFPAHKRYSEDYHLWCDLVLDGANCILIDKELTYLYKSRYGAAGLSASLWEMEKGELDLYINFIKLNKINISMGCFLLIYSFIKFIKRVIISKLNWKSK